MKLFLAGALVLCASICFAAVSLDEIVKLSELKTSDEVILQLIQKDGLAKPVSSKDVIYLKQHGVSDRVVRYMMKVSKHDVAVKLPPQEGTSTQISENMRSYYTTGKNGKKVRVVTNLDEKGKRMGGEVPPEPEPAPRPAQEKAPQEVRVIVENDSRSYDDYSNRPEYDDQEYVDDRYLPPSAYPPSYLEYYPPYAPYYYPYHHPRPHPQADPNQPNWRYDQGLDKPRRQPQQRPGKVIPGPGGQSVRRSRMTKS